MAGKMPTAQVFDARPWSPEWSFASTALHIMHHCRDDAPSLLLLANVFSCLSALEGVTGVNTTMDDVMDALDVEGVAKLASRPEVPPELRECLDIVTGNWNPYAIPSRTQAESSARRRPVLTLVRDTGTIFSQGQGETV